jgi:hypothetical protein
MTYLIEDTLSITRRFVNAVPVRLPFSPLSLLVSTSMTLSRCRPLDTLSINVGNATKWLINRRSIGYSL